MIFIVFDKKCSSSGVATLVNKFAVHGNFNKKRASFRGHGYATINWRITLTNY